MSEADARIRLYVDCPLAVGQTFCVDPGQSHYLVNVMRQGPGAYIKVFNGTDGEWLCEIREARKKAVMLAPLSALRAQSDVADVELWFAPIRRERTYFIVEKATELGVRCIRPVFTRYTNSERIRLDKLMAHATEAAEQCNGLSVPHIAEPAKLTALLEGRDTERRLLFCDERMQEATPAKALAGAPAGPWAILIGPEGGFAPEEQALLARQDNIWPVSLGPRILRADTAAVSALTLWHQLLGDWA